MSEFPSGMTEADFISYWTSVDSPWIGDALSCDDVIGDIKTTMRLLVDCKQRLAAAEARVDDHAVLLNEFAGHVQKLRGERDEARARLAAAEAENAIWNKVACPVCRNDYDVEAKGGRDE